MDLPGNARIRDFMDKLTATTNVSKYVELPMIAVMGDTSSGKSSLLSSISMVELPSNSKLTTRCPIMLRMSKSKTKYATVAVQWKHKPDGVSESDLKFPMKTITEDLWDSLPTIIENAQQHIITCTSKEVARDCVHVNVFAPYCHDLTLIDLPGIVRSRGEGESASIVEDIDGLIQDYLRNSRCVILAVVPANVDFHNSQIMADAKEVDPDTTRTIPVITKPDLIDSGAEDDVLQLLRGEKIKFDLGFHMVRGRGQADLDQTMTIDGGLAAESSFFDNIQPWRDVANRHLFGTAHLRTKLGELQLQMIRDSIPNIVKDMTEKKKAAEIELKEMGQVFGTTSDRLLFFRKQVHTFLSHLNASLTGNGFAGNSTPASAELHKAANCFQNEIAKCRFANITTLSIGTRVLATTDEGETVKGSVLQVSKDSIEVKHDDAHDVDNDEEVTIYRDLSLLRRDPQWLMDIISERRTHTLPCFLNEQVFRSISSDFMQKDCVPKCDKLLLKTFSLLSTTIDSCMDSSAMGSRFQGLRLMVQQRAKLEAQKFFMREKSRLQAYLVDEMDPYTQNHYLFENLSKKRNDSLKTELKEALKGVCSDWTTSDSLSSALTRTMSQIDTVVDAIFDRNQKKSVDQHIAEEMEAVLDSYGKVAMKRLIDVVPMKCRRLFRETPDAIREALDSVRDDELQVIMQDSRSFLRRHQELKVQVEEMEKGLALLGELQFPMAETVTTTTTTTTNLRSGED